MYYKCCLYFLWYCTELKRIQILFSSSAIFSYFLQKLMEMANCKANQRKKEHLCLQLCPGYCIHVPVMVKMVAKQRDIDFSTNYYH